MWYTSFVDHRKDPNNRACLLICFKYRALANVCPCDFFFYLNRCDLAWQPFGPKRFAGNRTLLFKRICSEGGLNFQ